MLTEKQIEEIKEHLEKAQNPVFFYDNDCDGLCSFLLLRRFLGRGKGVAVRSYPDLNEQYAKKAEELNADYVFVLDKPVVSKEFIEEIGRLNLPLVWIDHHAFEGEINAEEIENLWVYDPARNKGKEKSEEPVTYWCYKIANRKEDLWLGVIGCIADHFLPDFSEEFAERYGEFWGKGMKEPFDAYYNTEIGRIAQAFNFGLKDSTSNIVRLQNFLVSCNGPDEVFLEMTGNHSFRKKYQEIRKRYDGFLEKAKECVKGDLLFFAYGGDLSISADISNELSYLYPGKYIVVAYRKGEFSNISLRGDNVRGILERVLKNFQDATGGGHENAVGARIKTEDLEEFENVLGEEVERK
jgi:single-stranded DNA-specific DHH superfamily exonuclease